MAIKKPLTAAQQAAVQRVEQKKAGTYIAPKQTLSQITQAQPWYVPKPPISPVQGWTQFGDVTGTQTAPTKAVGGVTTSTWVVTAVKPQELWALGMFGEQAKTMEAGKAGSITSRNDIIAQNLFAGWKTTQADVEAFLGQQKWFQESSAEDKQRTITAITNRLGQVATEKKTEAPTTEPTAEAPTWTPWKYMKDWVLTDILWYGDLDKETQALIDWMSDADKKMLDMKRWSDANAKAEYLRQAKMQQEYLTAQRADTIQIRNLQWEIETIQASQRLRDAGKNVDNLIQNYAYLGQMWAPWISAQRLTAIKDHVAEAEKKYAELKQIETNYAQIRALGVKVDHRAFEKQMADIADDLNMKVWTQIQQALNDMTAADMAGQLDTIDWVTQFKRSLLEKLDNSISWYTEWSLKQMQYVTEQYTKIADDAQLRIKEWTTNQWVFDPARSVGWFMVDKNNVPMYDRSGNSIPTPAKIVDTVVDKASGKMVIISQNPDGTMKYETHDVMTPEEAGWPKIETIENADGTKTSVMWNRKTQSYEPISWWATQWVQPSGNIIQVNIPTMHEWWIMAKVDSVAAPSMQTAFSEMAAAWLKPAINQEEWTTRTYEQQKKLYDAYKAGWPLAAAPGTSKHEKGLSIDITNVDDKMVAIMNKNGWFQTAWPDDQWHFDYQWAKWHFDYKWVQWQQQVKPTKDQQVANRQLESKISWDKRVDNFNTLEWAYKKVQAVSTWWINKKNKATVDQALIMLFNKVLDPNSVVKEWEYARSVEWQAYLDTIAAKYNRFVYGWQWIDDNTRKEMLSVVWDLYNSAKQWMSSIKNQYLNTASDMWWTEQFVENFFQWYGITDSWAKQPPEWTPQWWGSISDLRD